MRICFVHAHPDDETLASGALVRFLVETGHEVSVLTATRGEEGEVVAGPLSYLAGTPELDTKRVEELAGALRELGVERHGWLGDPPASAGPERRYRDSGMRWIREGVAGPADGTDTRSLCAAELTDVTADVVAWLKETRAELVVSYDSDGGYGHPDHVRMHDAAVAAAAELGIGFAALAREPGAGVWWFPLENYLDTVIQALEHHATQLSVRGTTVTHSGGQSHPVPTSVGLTPGPGAEPLVSPLAADAAG
ncbi:MAG: PIG-L family deacetylase [Arachnia sp.]